MVQSIGWSLMVVAGLLAIAAIATGSYMVALAASAAGLATVLAIGARLALLLHHPYLPSLSIAPIASTVANPAALAASATM